MSAKRQGDSAGARSTISGQVPLSSRERGQGVRSLLHRNNNPPTISHVRRIQRTIARGLPIGVNIPMVALSGVLLPRLGACLIELTNRARDAVDLLFSQFGVDRQREDRVGESL